MTAEIGPLWNMPPANCGSVKNIKPSEAGKPVTILQLKSGSVVGSVINITLGIQVRGDNETVEPINSASLETSVRAHVTWGTGNTSFPTAVCDYLLGTQIAVGAENIQVDAEYMTWVPPWLKDNPSDALCAALAKRPEFIVHAGLAYGCVGRNARLTELVAIQHPNETMRVFIPPYALNVTFQPFGAGSVRVKIFGYADNLASTFDFTATGSPADFGIAQAIPLWNGARFVEVTSINGTDVPLYGALIFGLSF